MTTKAIILVDGEMKEFHPMRQHTAEFKRIAGRVKTHSVELAHLIIKGDKEDSQRINELKKLISEDESTLISHSK